MRDSTWSIADSIVLVVGLIALVVLHSLTLFSVKYLFGYHVAYFMGAIHLYAIQQLVHALNKGKVPKS